MARWVRAALILVLVVAASACGEADDGVSATSTSSTTPADPAGEGGDTTTMAPADVAECEVEGRAIATATEAYRVANGAYPTALDELVGDWIGAAPTFEWEYEAVGEGFTLVGPCEWEWETRITTTVGGEGP